MFAQGQPFPIHHALQSVAASKTPRTYGAAATGNGPGQRYQIRWGHSSAGDGEIVDQWQMRPPKGDPNSDHDAD
jgi:hypothetical protein